MQLTAGQLSMQYENGFLRWITAGKDEVLRMIYFAVRDKNWGTVPGRISSEKVLQDTKSFTVSYEMLFEQDDIQMLWRAVITGNSDNSIVFDIKGKAVTSFEKNRTGFCVLHPIKECAGRKVRIRHTDGSTREYTFPVYISPHQPFKNITAMQWELNDDCDISVQFEGDVFETEDHRNWTDNNFKTYCTPLELPFPVRMNEGEEVHQVITVKVEGSFANEATDDVIEIVVKKEKFHIPKIGVGRASERNENYNEALKILSSVGFNHYRVDIHLNDPYWVETVKEVFKEAELLNTKTEIALFVFAGCKKKLQHFVEEVKTTTNIEHIIVLEENARCISNNLFQEVLLIIRPQLPRILIGAGTDTYFTELNRSNFTPTDIDFVSYSINPQVHAFDDASLVENAAAQAETVHSAKHKFNKPVHVSPVTLKMRYNPDATDKTSFTLPPADERQQTFFGAGWTLASIKYLAESGASSITYYETEGDRGLMKAGETFSIFPMMAVFSKICSQEVHYIREAISSDPSICTSLVFGKVEEEYMALANHKSSEISVTVWLQQGMHIIETLSEDGQFKRSYLHFEENGQQTIKLKSREIIFIRL